MSNSNALRRYRRIMQAALILFLFLMPVLNILRFDSSTRVLIVLGRGWSLGLKEGFYADPSISGAASIAIHFFLNAILPWVMILSVFPLFGFFLGRYFCGWLCPKGAMFEVVDFLSLKLTGRRSLYGEKPNDPEERQDHRLLYGLIALSVAAIFPPLAGISLTGYLISPQTVWHQILTRGLSFGVKAGIIGVTTYMFITSLLVRHTFYKYICGEGKGLFHYRFGEEYSTPEAIKRPSGCPSYRSQMTTKC